MTTAKEMREKTAQELATDEQALRKTLFETRYKHATRQLEDTAALRRNRRDLARMLQVKAENVAKNTAAQTRTEKK